MADIDIVLDIYQSVSTSTSVGTKSPYAHAAHPGTGNLIEGWKWDKRTWPSDIELKATDYAPTVYDPDTNFISEEQFQSGIGDNKDLKLDSVNEERANNIRYWVPRINHGYFYMRDQQWYLYSDDAVRLLMDATVTSGVLQYKDLEFQPKPGIPISVRRYKWNYEKSRYEINLDFRKKEEFTGIVTDGEEADTVDDNGVYLVANIDASAPELVVEYGPDPRVVLNQNWEVQVGTSGTLSSLEFIGISDGVTNEYHLPYAPVSPSGLIQLITWDERNSNTTYSWSRIDSTDEFTTGPYQQYKLDEHLGIITFGDYDESTTSGAGMRPSAAHQIGMVYTRGLQLIYEPVNTSDWVEPRTSDTNPLHNPMNQGFVKVTSQSANPQWIQLEATNIDGDATDGYEMDLGNTTAQLVATVLSNQGEEMEGEIVTFEILSPEFGTFSNLELETQSITNNLGAATVQYVPPSAIEDIGQATTTISDDSSVTTVTVENLVAPDTVEEVYLYKVLTTDEVLGVPTSSVQGIYEDYITDNDIDQDPDGSSASVDFEEQFREAYGLLTPTTYEDGDLVTGAKVIVTELDAGVIDPNWAEQGANDPDYTFSGQTSAPIIPSSMLTAGTAENPFLELTYSGVLDAIDEDEFKAYFVVCPATTRVRAKVTNTITGKTVYSNIVSITINIPDPAAGVQIVQDIDDIQGTIKRTRHIDEFTDEELITHSGELWSEYTEDRRFERRTDYLHWSSDESTIGYWALESGSLQDSSLYDNDLTNINAMVTAAGIIGGGYRSTIPGTPQYLEAPNLYTDLNLQSGTIDFVFRSTGYTQSGSSFKLMEFTVTGSNQKVNSLQIFQENTSLSGHLFKFSYLVSGETGNTPQVYLECPPETLGICLTDSEWHSIRVTWDTDQDAQSVNVSGELDGISMLDDESFRGVTEASLGFRPDVGTVVGGTVQAVVGDLTASGHFHFDEIRYSTSVRTDEWPPIETVTSGESFISWFRRTRKADSIRLGLEDMVVSGEAPARLPLGFRLKSAESTVASMLDKATFITVNTHLPSGYYDEE